MKNLAKSLSLFLLSLPISWGFYLALASQSQTGFVNLIGAQSHWGAVHDRTKEWSNNPKLRASTNVLFFGSSTCYSGIDPHALQAYGMNGFNFCSSSQGLGNTASLVAAAMSQSRPKIVAVDIYPSLWSGKPTRIESARDWALNAQLPEIEWTKALFSNAIASADVYNVMLTAWNAVNQKMGWHQHSAKPDANGTYKGLGFVARTYPQLSEHPTCPADSVRVFSDEFCTSLNQIISICRRHDAQLVLINPPQLCPESFDKPECWSEIPMIDGMEWPGHNKPRFYYDDHHLEQTGAASYSEWLTTQLIAFD